jgi:diamine N-acetyltransferase
MAKISQMEKIYIRPLEVDDAKISYKWRNQDIIWQYTGSRPDREITLTMEQEWIKRVLTKSAERRFAICISSTHEYIGNVQLTKIKNGQAEFHIFIGNVEYWGFGLGGRASNLVIKYGIDELKLKEIFLFVNKDNVGAIKLYKKTGFIIHTEFKTRYRMVFHNPRKEF